MQQFLVYRHGVLGTEVGRIGQPSESGITNTPQPVACKILAILERSVGCTPVKK
ncbi:MAG: hypothetical protein VXY24_05205 [Pseudomonadota bacterium]|nr:hypothetical protein [Pseudomonadota bacterium]